MKQFTCPECGSHYFGTSNCTGPQDTWIRRCHGYYDDARRCNFSFVVADDDKYFADEQNGSKEIDMELRKEYAEIANAYGYGLSSLARSQIKLTALACQELADRPPKELTNDEVDSTFDDMPGGAAGFCREWGYRQFANAIIAAFLAKQREPQVVKFRAARWKDGAIDMLNASEHQCQDWQWLEPAQEFEVKLP